MGGEPSPGSHSKIISARPAAGDDPVPSSVTSSGAAPDAGVAVATAVGGAGGTLTTVIWNAYGALRTGDTPATSCTSNTPADSGVQLTSPVSGSTRKPGGPLCT